MKNYVLSGHILPFTSASPVVSGQGVTMGALFGVAAVSAPANTEFEAQLTGVFVLPKADDNMTAGAIVYWDAVEKEVTTAAADGANRKIGATIEAAGTSAATVRVRLDGVAA
jgi:predicted RecA/RadA family phage recombinase